jgi:hypothetical protein
MMCINNKNVINNYGSLQDLILLFKISIVPRNNFFKIHRQFGHTLSKGSLAVLRLHKKERTFLTCRASKKEDILATNDFKEQDI